MASHPVAGERLAFDISERLDSSRIYVDRPKIFEQAKAFLLKGKETTLTASPSLRVTGAGGFGKTTLAQMLANDAG